jgi:regulatory protein
VALDRVLTGLAAQELLSTERFVARYVEERMARGFGPVRIRAELRQRGLDDPLVDTYLPRDETVWMDLLAQAHDRKFGPQPPADRVELARRARFLEYRGFTSPQVSRFLSDHHSDL